MSKTKAKVSEPSRPPGRPPKPDHELKHKRRRPLKGAQNGVPKVRPGDRVVETPAPSPLPVAPPPPRNKTSNRQQKAVAPKSESGSPARAGVVRRSFEEALQIICEPETRGEGLRHGWLGDTGSGKTSGIRRLITSRAGAGGVLHLVHDDSKREPEYPGSVVESFEAAPEDASIVTLRGDPFAGTVVEPETVAAICLQLAMARVPVRFVIDELDRACTPGGRELAGVAIRDCLTKGRAMQLSVIWSTQSPARAPREVIDQSTTISLCQLGPRALNYLDDRLFFDPELLSVVPTLQVPTKENNLVSEFVIFQKGRRWNRTIYRCQVGDR